MNVGPIGAPHFLFLGPSARDRPLSIKVCLLHNSGNIRASCRFGLRLRLGRLDGEELLCDLSQYSIALGIAQTGRG
jgi:hypothetical protein